MLVVTFIVFMGKICFIENLRVKWSSSSASFQERKYCYLKVSDSCYTNAYFSFNYCDIGYLNGFIEEEMSFGYNASKINGLSDAHKHYHVKDLNEETYILRIKSNPENKRITKYGTYFISKFQTHDEPPTDLKYIPGMWINDSSTIFQCSSYSP